MSTAVMATSTKAASIAQESQRALDDEEIKAKIGELSQMAQDAAQAADQATLRAKAVNQLTSAMEAEPRVEAAKKAADDALANIEKAVQEAKIQQSTRPNSTSLTRVDYPWATGKTAEGSTIVHFRPVGRGHRVCVEAEEEGRLIRRLVAASEVQFDREYLKNGKNAAAGQNTWSINDRGDFLELLWVTFPQMKRKNIAARKMDAQVDCCVKFKTKGINILTVSSLRRVLGKDIANSNIAGVCTRDGFAPPWHTGPISIVYDPTAKIKDLKERQAMRDECAKANAATSGDLPLATAMASTNDSSGDVAGKDRISELEKRVNEVEKKLDNVPALLDEKFGKMTDTLMNFMTMVGDRLPPPHGM
ncbi:uncharacterized protein DNG_05119 [Cephalotrichum gorgonifer]|uniref:Uncharacterized protein n=1 Tax=Cephalotrichum gorgonifer TaxID=2041049 RepID=A0AAE8SV89_9PEZI|nr:uncharacterized protein DNG_05119 [Cephalotrichum gorgonifer]